jgi:hypothetical protein
MPRLWLIAAPVVLFALAGMIIAVQAYSKRDGPPFIGIGEGAIVVNENNRIEIKPGALNVLERGTVIKPGSLNVLPNAGIFALLEEPPPINPMPLGRIQTLTFEAGVATASRWGTPVEQLHLIGVRCPSNNCPEFDVPPFATCENLESGDLQHSWNCTIPRPAHVFLDFFDVTCEGYATPFDLHTTADTCSLTYSLIDTRAGSCCRPRGPSIIAGRDNLVCAESRGGGCPIGWGDSRDYTEHELATRDRIVGDQEVERYVGEIRQRSAALHAELNSPRRFVGDMLTLDNLFRITLLTGIISLTVVILSVMLLFPGLYLFYLYEWCRGHQPPYPWHEEGDIWGAASASMYSFFWDGAPQPQPLPDETPEPEDAPPSPHQCAPASPPPPKPKKPKKRRGKKGFALAPPAQATPSEPIADPKDDAQCAVCLERLVDVPEVVAIIGCGHAFCKGCVDDLERQECPKCRHPFTHTMRTHL